MTMTDQPPDAQAPLEVDPEGEVEPEGSHDVPTELTELYEVLEWNAAVPS